MTPEFLLYGALSGASSQIIKSFLPPTPMERSQIRHMEETLRLARDQYEAGERRARQAMEHQRALELDKLEYSRETEFEKQKREHDFQIEKIHMAKWPLKTTPREIIRVSKSHFALASDNTWRWPLNVIVKYLGAPTELAALTKAGHRLEGAVKPFGNQLLYYSHWSKSDGEVPRPGFESVRALEAALYSFLATEPTAVIAVSNLEPNRLTFDVCQWATVSGEQGEDAAMVRGRRIELDLLEHPDLPPERTAEAAILQIIAAVYDGFRIATQLTSPTRLALFDLFARTPDIFVYVQPEGWGEQQRVLLKDLWIANILGTLRQVGEVSPSLAIEAAARFAVEAKNAGLTELGQSLLAISLAFVRAQSNIEAPTEEGLIKALVSDFASLSPQLEAALAEIAGVRRLDRPRSDIEHRERLFRITKPVSPSGGR